MTALLFWAAVALVVYVYLLFPGLLWLRSRWIRRPHAVADRTPALSLIICAHNEAEGIVAKLENVGRLDYPRERLEVIVASDGSTDATEDRVRAHGDRVRLLALARGGKIRTLNAAVSEARGEILVFSDANSLYGRGALRALVRPFADPAVGSVAGDQRYLGSARREECAEGERAYWDLDRRLKVWQSLSGSVTSATGAIHAIRRELYRPVPAGVTDDFWISTNAVALGRRLVFAPDAAAFEPPAASSGLEFQRKVRVMTRGLRGVWLRRELLDPRRHGFYALQLLSHKVLRRLVFVPLIVLAVTAPLLWNDGSLYRLATTGQALFYGLAGAGAALRRVRPLALPFYFCLVNAACMVAAWNVVRGRRIDTWEPRRRAGPISPPLADAAGRRPGS